MTQPPKGIGGVLPPHGGSGVWASSRNRSALVLPPANTDHVAMSPQPTGDATLSKLEAVARGMGEGTLALDDERCVTYVNPAGETVLRWPLEDLLHRSRYEALHPVTVEAGAQARHAAVGSDEVEALATVWAIREALADDRLVLYAQPIVDLQTGATAQHELLIRMIDVNGAIVSPGAFLPAAEAHGAIHDIDRWVIHEAMQFVNRGNAVQINLSAHSFGDPETFDYIERELLVAGADPRLFGIEITETAVLANPSVATQIIGRLRELGCPTALDDFGMGHAGFRRLKTLPLSHIKIDIEFVRDLLTVAASAHVVRAVIELARSFGYKTIAEGVEDEATLDMLRLLGVDFAQGYFLGRPAPAGDVYAGDERPDAGNPAADGSDVMWLGRIRAAIAEDGFILLAQPVVALYSGDHARHRLFLRMIGDEGELIMPDAFLPTAARFGLIAEIDRWVLRAACGLAARGIAVEVGLCAATLADPDIGACVERELVAAGAPAPLIAFEIATTALAANEAPAVAFITRVRSLGCEVALGEFSVSAVLCLLQRVHVDALKIAPAVVGAALTDAVSERVVCAIVRLAGSFGLYTVAEGVDDLETLAHLRALGVDHARGGQLGQPITAALLVAAPLRAAG